jgi:hypothetical protein
MAVARLMRMWLGMWRMRLHGRMQLDMLGLVGEVIGGIMEVRIKHWGRKERRLPKSCIVRCWDKEGRRHWRSKHRIGHYRSVAPPLRSVILVCVAIFSWLEQLLLPRESVFCFCWLLVLELWLLWCLL